jgi:uncharacterized membrane protein
MDAIARLVGDRHGSISILTAMALSLVLGAAAIAVDLGSLFFESRKLQGAADAAALAAAATPADPTGSVHATLRGSTWRASVTPTVTVGTYTPNAATAAAARFVTGGSATNAARVVLTADVPTFFGSALGLRAVRLRRAATAVQVDMAAFSLGSRLAALDHGVANQLLGGLLGTTVALTAADTNALINADIDALAFVSALRTEIGLTAGTFEQTLAATTTLPRELAALERVLTSSGQAGAAAAVAKLRLAAPATSMTTSALIGLGDLGKQDRALDSTSIKVSAFNLLQSMLQIGGGARQVALNLGGTTPGLTGLTATLAVGQRTASSPWLAFTRKDGAVVRTAQTRLQIVATVLPSSALALLGIGSVRLPLYVELAEAQAKLSGLACTAGARAVTLQVAPSIGHAAIADVPSTGLSDFTKVPTESAAAIAAIPGIRAYGSARVDLSAGGWQSVPFSEAEIAATATKTVSSSTIVGGIAASLVSSLALTVQIGPVTLSTSPILTALKPVLTLAAPLLDGVVQSLLDALGVHLGQADVRIDGVRCGTAALVA